MNIVPPKLQSKPMLGKISIAEALVLLGGILLFLATKSFQLIVPMGAFLFLSWRFRDDKNFWHFVRVGLAYYSRPQIFTRRMR